MPRARRLPVFRLLLLAYPPSFRRRKGAQIVAAVAAELDGGGSAAKTRAVRWLRLRMVADLAAGIPGEWRRSLGIATLPRWPAGGATQRLRVHARIAARGLRQSPSFTAVAVLSVALGVAASSAVFSLADGVLRRPMPYEQPEELVFIWNHFGGWGVPRGWVSGAQIAHLRAHAEGFDGFVALSERDAMLATDSEPTGSMVSVGEVSGALFSLLGVDAASGRTLRVEEEGVAAPRVTVLGSRIWRALFNGDPGVIGNQVRIDGLAYTVVGVMPQDFHFAIHAMEGVPGYPDLWVPAPVDLAAEPRGNNRFALLARLADGVSMQQAAARLAAATAEYARAGATDVGDDFRSFMVPLRGDLTGSVRSALLLVGAAVALVMLLVCANLATLYVGRGIDAEQQTALCAALGAGVWARAEVRLLETVLVTVAGGALGMALCGWTVSALLALAPAQLPRAAEVVVDSRVLAFSIALTLLVGLVMALLPWLRERRTDIATVLRSGGRSVSGPSRRAQRVLVMVQVMLATTLLFSAALVGRSLVALGETDPGFRTDGVLLATVRAPAHLIEDDRQAVAALEQLRQRVVAGRDVLQAGYVEFLPLTAGGDQNGFSFAGAPGSGGRPEDDEVVADHVSAGAGYFAAAGIDIIEGRAFSDADRADSQRVFIIDETLARRFWPQGGAAGGTLRYFNEEGDGRIIGVARHARRHDLRADGRPQIYSPLAQRPVRSVELAMLTESEGAPPLRELRSYAARVDPRLAVSDERAMRDHVGAALSPWRFMLQLLVLFAAAAVALATLGVYGVVAVSVSRRRREIGLRMALGARAADVGLAVVREAMRLVLAGLALALLTAAATGRLLADFLFGVAPLDAASFAAAAALLLVVALLAIWRPARRATRVDPAQTLQSA